MSTEHPSSPQYQPTGPKAPVWSLYVFQVADRNAQQRVLRALLDLGRDGITGLGTRRGSEHFVIVDYSTDADKAAAKRVVKAIDPQASLTFSGRQRQILRDA